MCNCLRREEKKKIYFRDKWESRKGGRKRKGASHKLLFIQDRRERKPCEYKSLLSFVGIHTKKNFYFPPHTYAFPNYEEATKEPMFP